MSNIYFSCNIIIFDTYQLSTNILNKNKKDNISSKTQLNNKEIIKSQIIKENNNKINFFIENKINLYNNFMNREITYLPVVRIFGTTKSGQKCCVNIHNYFPYFYIGITKENYFNYNNKESLRAFAITLENTFIEYRTEIGRKNLFQNMENNKDKDNNDFPIIKEPEQVIHNIIPEYKTNIYGYYNKESVFLKVECYNPADIKDLMFVLSQSCVNNNFYQCFDAHISYSTHFFGDFHLYGMGTIKIKNFSVREELPKNNYDIDYINKFTVFQNNIQWESNDVDDEFTIHSEIPKDEIIKFIDKYNDFMIWDKNHIDLMKLKIKYNSFNKSSNSTLEIDCTIDDIIIDSPNEDEVEDLDEKDVNKEVNISNLKTHIKHCTSLIDLWKEEIRRRKNSNLPPLKFEKISDQGVFILMEDFFLKKKEESEYLLKLNYEITNNFFDIEELQFLSLEENNLKEESDDINTNKKSIREMINKKLTYRNKYIEQFSGHSYEWYKEHYNKSLFQNIYEIITEHVDNNDQEQLNILSDEDSNEYKKIKEDYEFDLSCFDSERTLNELSINMNTRNLYKGILSNKTFYDLNMATPNKKNKDDFNLGESSIKKLFFSDEKEEEKISKGKYLLIADSAMKKLIEYNSTNKKKNKNENIEELKDDINTLFYSDINDYKKFYKMPMKFNPRFNAFKGNSLEMMVNNYNKIIYKEKKEEFQKIQSELIIKEDNCNDIKEYDNFFLNKFYNKYIDNNNINNSILISDYKNENNLLYEKYDIEISPITEKKYIPLYKINSRFKSPKEKDNKDKDFNFSNFISSAIFGSESSAKKEGNKLCKKYEKYYEDNNNMTVLSLEILADSKSNLAFNYLTDSIICIFFSISDDNFITNQKLLKKNDFKKNIFYNFIITCIKDDEKLLSKRYNYSHQILRKEYFINKESSISDNNDENNIEIFYTKDEIELLRKSINLIKQYDPDIICGYEPESLSIGYLIKRGEFLGIPMFKLLNRLNNNKLNNMFSEDYIRNKVITNSKKNSNFNFENEPRYYDDYKKLTKFRMKFGNLVKLKGRIIIDVWRKMSQEIKVNDYSFENVVFHALNIRESQIDYFTLKSMINSKKINSIIFVLNYYLKRTKYNLILLNKFDIINRCTQFVKIYGIDFESNLTRGSQYKVEGVLSHLAKSKNVVLLSATRDQLIHQSPPKFTPIVMEPPKNIFYNPVIVLDFQSLYPSIMIAYNLCYSTCLGKLLKEEELNNDEPLKKMGVTLYNKNLYEMLVNDFHKSKFYKKESYLNYNQDQESQDFFNFVKDSCFLSPCRVLFLKKHIKEGLIPIILKELLLTRIMIKKSMKLYDKNSDIYKFLHNRQLGIKGLANVIYGYTSAGFSGRMPNINISDSILSLGRQMLKTAIDYIENKKPYELKVVYGDTDSLFISVKNKSIEESIDIGKKLAEEITKLNPEPIKLQFEKVYCPLIFSAKKHYAGYKYEDKNSFDSIKNKKSAISLLDTKGLENVRRDSCNLVCKIVEKIIKILFDEKDLSKVKKYLFECFDKIIKGKVILKDFIFSKEVKFGKYRGKILPPSAQVANDLHKRDQNFFAVYKQRVPYLIYNNPNGEKTLKNSVIYPFDFFEDKSLSINSNYYITMIKKVIERFLGQIGVNIEEWYLSYKRPANIGSNIYFCKNMSKKTLFSTKKKSKNDLMEKHLNSLNKRKQDIEEKKNFFGNSKMLKDDTKRSDILNYFQPLESKKSLYNISSLNQSKNDIILNIEEEEDKEILDLKFYEFNEKEEIIEVKKEEENKKMKLVKIRENQMIYLENHKKLKILQKKKSEIRNICKFCTGFDHFNINDIEDIPCMNIQCKVFYEKLKINNEIEEYIDFNKNIEKLEFDFTEVFE